jgi:monofunctional glycosyltransferase
VAAEIKGDVSADKRKTGGWSLRRFMRLAVTIAAVLVAIPLVLVPVYAVLPPVSTLMVRDLLMLRGYDRQWVSLDDISPHLVRSVVSSEDGQYCSHYGVDWDALLLVLNSEGGPSRGASTITMQTVKNLYLWNSRSYIRKGLEIPLALYADLVWSKPRAMEIYLNIAEWGPGIYGAEAAAQYYFGKPAKNLSRHEAALLASALPNPILRNPGKPTRKQSAYARLVERRASQSGGYLTCLYAPD